MRKLLRKKKTNHVIITTSYLDNKFTIQFIDNK